MIGLLKFRYLAAPDNGVDPGYRNDVQGLTERTKRFKETKE